jgi:hypothetical protein
MHDDDELIGDISSWSPEDISQLWEELDRLRLKAREEGWEEEFLKNVSEWVDAGGRYPVKWLKMRRKDWVKIK